jgi:hypothetical protein
MEKVAISVATGVIRSIGGKTLLVSASFCLGCFMGMLPFWGIGHWVFPSTVAVKIGTKTAEKTIVSRTRKDNLPPSQIIFRFLVFSVISFTLFQTDPRIEESVLE